MTTPRTASPLAAAPGEAGPAARTFAPANRDDAARPSDLSLRLARRRRRVAREQRLSIMVRQVRG